MTSDLHTAIARCDAERAKPIADFAGNVSIAIADYDLIRGAVADREATTEESSVVRSPRSGDAEMASVPDAYRVIVDEIGCPHCCASRLWTVIGPDEVCEGQSWEDEDTAQDLAERMCKAFAAGRASVAPNVGAQVEPVAWRVDWHPTLAPEGETNIIYYHELADAQKILTNLAASKPPMAGTITPLYTDPPAPPGDVTDAMVERACVGAYGAWDWSVIPESDKPDTRKLMRKALSGALSEVAK